MPGMMVSSFFWVPENDEETMDHSEAVISEVEVEEYEVEVEPIEPIEETVIEDSKEPVEDESEVQLGPTPVRVMDPHPVVPKH